MYYVSQIFVILGYIFLGVTYLLKKRSVILQISLLSLVSTLLGYAFLSAHVGMAMMFVAICRNIIFCVQDVKVKSFENKKNDLFILLFLYLITIILAVFTYEGLFSLLSVLATMVYTYSIWQKNSMVYKILGIPASLLWVCYNIFVNSLFGIILESLLVICEIIGVIEYNKKRDLL